jgi:hypothetical protein
LSNQATIKKEAKQRELQNLRCEILVTVLNQAERRRLIRDYIAKQLSAEKGEKPIASIVSMHWDISLGFWLTVRGTAPRKILQIYSANTVMNSQITFGSARWLSRRSCVSCLLPGE